ncbi:hypothetical protein [Fodinicola feengrottensis]|uniref:Thiazolylpeptide-type bacteriocin n=1 Tax=Fodinicola feengrottensis TaxID=435914 RepID=A0ABN2G307_9ACTN|nr:hypothetical protein [Fodinicola feengrottensis]
MSEKNTAPEPEETTEADEVEAHGVLGLQKLDTDKGGAPGFNEPAMSCSSCVAGTVCTAS